MIVDIYTHIFPERFFQELERGSPKLGNMGKRLRSVRKLFDLDMRFRDMDEIGADYRQIISLPNPPLEDIAEGAVANNLAKVANDSMAELVAQHPKRFPAFAAAVNMNDVDFSIREAERAIKMGARGVQTFTNITGHPLDEPRFRPFFNAMAAHDLPIWIHPARTSAIADYASEERSRFEMWWCFGWPYETTVAMCRLVFDGVYDRHPKLKFCLAESAIGWIPFVVQEMDYRYKRQFERRKAAEIPLKNMPSEIFKRQVWATYQTDFVGLHLVDFFGDGHIMWGSDYPHPDSTWPFSDEIVAKDSAHLPENMKRKVYRENAAALYGL